MEKQRELQLLIKPVSNLCNMACRYCFYEDVSSKRENSSNRDHKDQKIMSPKTAEEIVKKSLEAAQDTCTFGFQGGEPTLAGLAFYEKWIQLVEKYKNKHTQVFYTIQTNGLALDQQWISFFKQHQFLVGISMDGTASLHNSNRKTAAGEDTFQKVLDHAKELLKAQVPVSVLCVLTHKNSNQSGKLYQFFKEQGFYSQQYIPCLDGLEEKRGCHPWSLTPADYEKALKDLFDLWYEDMLRFGKDGSQPVQIRTFQNWLHMLLGGQPEACTQYGRCSIQYVVEADGSVYPCDFYALDEYCLGNIQEISLEALCMGNRNASETKAGESETPAKHGAEMELPRRAIQFLQEGKTRGKDCQPCRWYPLCRGGCRRDYVNFIGEDSYNYFCPSFQGFFAYAIEPLEKLAAMLDVKR